MQKVGAKSLTTELATAWRRVLYWIAGRRPLKIISSEMGPYLERYYLFDLIGYRFYLHRFLESDPDRGLHDHPWSRAFSIVLSGFYIEELRLSNKYRRVRLFNSLTGDKFHRVIVPFHVPEIWTLFFHRIGNVKRWGFLTQTEERDLMLYDQYPQSDGQDDFRTKSVIGVLNSRRVPFRE